MKKINIGIIGAGMVGEMHIQSIKKNKRTNLVWISNRTKSVLDAKMKKYNILKGTINYMDILNDETVDAVIIATPPYLHSRIMIQSLNKGKHVLVEKPLCIKQADLNKIICVVKKHKNLVALECSARHTRLQPKYKFIKKMIDSGKIGEVYFIFHKHVMPSTYIEYNPDGLWSLDKKFSGGGPIMDWGCYDLSFHLGLLNDKPELKNIISFKKGGIKKFLDKNIKSNTEEHAACLMDFNNDLHYYYDCSTGIHSQESNLTQIYGTKGNLKFSYLTWDREDIEYDFIGVKGNVEKNILKVKSNGYDDNIKLIDHFIDCIINGINPVIPVVLACKHLKIIFKILK